MNPASTAAVNHGDSERAEIRKGGRPRKYRTVEQAHTAEMELQPLRRNSPNEATPPLQLVGNKRLADAKIGSPLSP